MKSQRCSQDESKDAFWSKSITTKNKLNCFWSHCWFLYPPAAQCCSFDLLFGLLCEYLPSVFIVVCELFGLFFFLPFYYLFVCLIVLFYWSGRWRFNCITVLVNFVLHFCIVSCFKTKMRPLCQYSRLYILCEKRNVIIQLCRTLQAL